MPIHDWTRVEDSTFSILHFSWIFKLFEYLNAGRLPPGFFATPEQYVYGLKPDVLALESLSPLGRSPSHPEQGGIAVLTAPPKVQPTRTVEFTRRPKTRYLAVRRASDQRVVAVIEIVSGGNKSSRGAVQEFVHKTVEFLERGLHLLVIDLHPPGPRDPEGLHNAIWQVFSGDEPLLPTGGPCSFTSFEANPQSAAAYATNANVGDPLPTVPLFLSPGQCVDVDLEPSYTSAFNSVPDFFRNPLESP